MPNSIGLLFWLMMIYGCSPPPTADQWKPVVYCAIKWSAPNQGAATLAFTKANAITQIPIAYHGGVDTTASGDISQQDIEQFSGWVATALPPDYCGPVVLDYERPWWKELRAKSINQDRLREILSIYVTGVRVAREIQPQAQWGYFGLPALRHTGNIWLDQELTLESIISQSKALYPDIYDCNPKKTLTNRVERHISTVLKQAAGRIPVYVFVSPRYCGQHKNYPTFIPDEAFTQQVNAAMQASWIDDDGKRHKIKGVILWDAYSLSTASTWEDLDQRHKHYLELLINLSTKWSNAMDEDDVLTVSPIASGCFEGLPTPLNSSLAIFEKNQGPMQERVPDTKIEGNRVINDLPSERVPK